MKCALFEKNRFGARHAVRVAIALAATFAALACSTAADTTPPSGCSLNSDCAAGLICALSRCRTQCVASVDCHGGSCIDDGRYPFCQPPAEKNTPCSKLSDCSTPLACASDYRCRNLCASDADCNVLGISGRVCAKDKSGVHYCADPVEVVAGVIVIAAPPGAPTTPVVEPGAIAASVPQGALIATNIGAQGGTVGTSGVTVTIPPGALAQDVIITIAPSASVPAGAVGSAYEIGPSGTTFAQPVTIAFSYTDSELAGLPPSDFAVETIGTDGKTWTPLSQIVVDVYAHTIAGQTVHLSPYALVSQVAGASAASEAGPDAASGSSEGGAFADATEPGADAAGQAHTADGSVVTGDGGLAYDATGDDGGGAGATDASTGVGAGDSSAGIGLCFAPSSDAGELPPGTASSPNTSIQGSSINAVDGYGVITQSVNSGPLSTTYSANLSLYFTDYANASSYVCDTKMGSRVLNLWDMNLASSTGPPQFMPGTYSRDTSPPASPFYIRATLAGYDASCGGQSVQAFCGGSSPGPLTLTAVSPTRISGSVSISGNGCAGQPPANIGVTFDVPLFQGRPTCGRGPVACCAP